MKNRDRPGISRGKPRPNGIVNIPQGKNLTNQVYNSFIRIFLVEIFKKFYYEGSINNFYSLKERGKEHE